MEKKYAILIVDDNVELTQSLRDIMETEGYDVTISHNGQDALANCRQKNFGLALIDIRLPDTSGTELIDDLAGLSPDMEYILITGYASLDSAIAAVKRNKVVSYETKPLDIERFLALIRQVFERKQAEEALRESEEKYHALFSSGNDAIFVHRLTTDGTIGKFIEVSNIACQRLGYSREELLALSVVDIIPPENLKDAPAPVAKLQVDKHVLFETVHLAKDGRRIPVEINTRLFELNGQPTILSIARDITERKKAEEKLRESEEREKLQAQLTEVQVFREKARFEMVVNSVADGVYVVDLNLNTTYWNPSAERITGWTAAEILSKPCADFLAHRDLQGNLLCRTPRCPFEEARSTEGPIGPDRVTGKAADGRDIPLSVSAAPVKDEAGTIIGFVEVFRDISAEVELEQLRSQLLSNVSHELRTPLASIKGFTSTLLRTDVEWSEEEQRDFLQTIDQETNRLTRLINDLLDMSRIEAGGLKLKKDNYHISEILDLVSSQLVSLTEYHRLKMLVPSGLPPVFVDEAHIGQVMTNLVENATKYSSEGSEITIEAKLAGDEINISVTDSGQGITPDLLGRVFDRFYQAESIISGRKSGTGLGLSICKGIIDAHGGRIWVESQPGEGSKFSFNLPVGKGEGESA